MPDTTRCGQCVFHHNYPVGAYQKRQHSCILLHEQLFDPQGTRDFPPCSVRIEGAPLTQAAATPDTHPLVQAVLQQHPAVDVPSLWSELDQAEARRRMLEGAFLPSMHDKLHLTAHRPAGLLEAAIRSEEQLREEEKARDQVRFQTHWQKVRARQAPAPWPA